MLFLGLALLALAIGLVVARRAQLAKLRDLQSTETATVEHLDALATSMREGMGEGGLLQYRTEVRGVVHCDAPLEAELSGTPCVYYAFTVSREYEETYIATDSQGRRQRRTRTGREVVAQNRRTTRFTIDDGTGRLTIQPDGADVIAETSLSDFQPGGGGVVQRGRFRMQVPRYGGGRRLLGHRFEEQVIPLGREIYVLGEVNDQRGQLVLERPADAEVRFMVSVKGEAQLTAELERSVKQLRLGSIAAAVVGLLLLMMGLTQGGAGGGF